MILPKNCRYACSLLACFFILSSLFSQTVTGPNGEVFNTRIVKDGLSDPWEIVYGPDNYLWITEARGYRVSRIDPVSGTKSVLLDVSNQRNFPRYDLLNNQNGKPWPQGGLQGLALHPAFLSGKPYVYLSYVYNFSGANASDNGCAVNSGGCFFTTRLVRYEYNVSAQALVNPLILCDSIPGSSDHNSGRIRIAPLTANGNDNYLFYTVGDMGAGQYENAGRTNKAQNKSSYEGKVLRFNLEPDADAGTYDRWIPNDNPFNSAVQSAVWSVGHRNAQGLAHAVVNGQVRMYSSEHGPFSDDEVNIIERGKNYGHPLVIGYNDGNYDGLAAGVTSNSSLPGIWHTTYPFIGSENQNAAAIGADLKLPIKTLYPSSNSFLTTLLHKVQNDDPTGDPNSSPNSWQSEAPSGMTVYQSAGIPGWNNSLLIAALKGGKMIRLKLNENGDGISGDTLNYFSSANRFRSVTVSPDGKKIYLIVDSSSITSGPSSSFPKVSLNRGAIMEFSYQSGGIAGGLNYKFYQGNWDRLPDFNTLTPVKTGNSANVSIGDRPAGIDDYFAFKWDGFITLPAAGTYTFETVSDDGSKLYFNMPYSAGAAATVVNDSVQSPQTRTGTVVVPAAGTYPITITFFDKVGGETMEVYWSGPGISRQRIPDNAFTSSGTGDQVAPSVPANLRVLTTTATAVTLDWEDATDNTGVAGYDVYAGGVLKYSSTASTITADGLQPNTAYTFMVKARDLAGNQSGFSNAVSVNTQGTGGGLAYKYYEGAWSNLPDFSSLTPVASGRSTNVDISVRPAGRDNNFAFVWEGYINIPSTGTYTFETVSDDGSKLYFNTLYSPNAVATVNNDGMHGAISATGTVTVPAAGTYPITITFFEREAEESMQVYWTGPGISRQRIPNSAFTDNAPAEGLTYKYYEGAWNTLPDFSTLTPVQTGKSANVDIGVRPAYRNDNFAFVWSGYINIPSAGNYTFETVSDDGSKLYFNMPYSVGAAATVNNDGMHGAISATGTVSVPAAGLYPVTITFFEREAQESMQVYWTGPGIARQPIPNSAFSGGVSAPTPPAPNLSYKYYEGAWSTLPDFNSLVPVQTGKSTNVDINVRPAGHDNNFGFLWEGFIRIPAAGNYTFETVSDDGSKLYFNTGYSAGATATVNNDGMHGAISATGTVYVPAAGVYPIAISFFEREAQESMQVYWSGPGIARQPIPDTAFVASQQTRNLTYKYYEGAWSSLPDFSTLTPVRTGISATPDISVRPAGHDDNFAFLWQGWINVPAAGSYLFETVSDDGSKFYFNSVYSPTATPLVSNDGMHPPLSASGTVNVPAAGIYPVAITFFEREGGENMEIYWSGPGFARQPVPASAFVAPPSFAAPMQASAGSPGQATAENRLAGTSVRLYPDPFRDRLSAELSLPAAGKEVSILVHDLQGRLLYRYQAGRLPAGKQTLAVPLQQAHLAEGVYMVTVQVNGVNQKTVQLFKSK